MLCCCCRRRRFVLSLLSRLIPHVLMCKLCDHLIRKCFIDFAILCAVTRRIQCDFRLTLLIEHIGADQCHDIYSGTEWMRHEWVTPKNSNDTRNLQRDEVIECSIVHGWMGYIFLCGKFKIFSMIEAEQMFVWNFITIDFHEVTWNTINWLRIEICIVNYIKCRRNYSCKWQWIPMWDWLTHQLKLNRLGFISYRHCLKSIFQHWHLRSMMMIDDRPIASLGPLIKLHYGLGLSSKIICKIFAERSIFQWKCVI